MSGLFLFSQLVITPILCVSDPSLLLANRADVRVVNFTNPRTRPIIFTKGIDDATAVDFIFRDGIFCWIDIAFEEIRCHSFDAFYRSKPKRMLFEPAGKVDSTARRRGLFRPQGLAIDWMTANLYWTDSLLKRVEVVDRRGVFRRGLFWNDIDEPRAIAVMPTKRLLFWTDWGVVPKIEMASMDGEPTSRRIFVDTDVIWPNGITIDYKTETVFWSDANKEQPHISAQHVDGSDRRVVASTGLSHPYAVTLYDRQLLWTDWKTQSVHAVDKERGGAVLTLLSGDQDGLQPIDLHVYSAVRQPVVPGVSSEHSCHSCSQLCLLSSGASTGFRCSCATGLLPVNDTHCAKQHESMLLLSVRNEIRVLTLDTDDRWFFRLPLKLQLNSVAVDYDPRDDLVYWADDQKQRIERGVLPAAGSVRPAAAQSVSRLGQHTDIEAAAGQMGGMAVDWIGRNVYWSDIALKRIGVARLDAAARKVVLSDDMDEPRTIVLDPARGYMFWSDWSKQRPRIERSDLDGSSRHVLVDSQIRWPNGLSLDLQQARVYWADADRGSIELCDMDGRGRRVLLSEHLPHLFGLAVLGEFVYWSDISERTIHRVNKTTGRDREMIADHVSDVIQLRAVSRSTPPGTNACGRNNGGCSHLCLFSSQLHHCNCPLGMELQPDLLTCSQADTLLVSRNGSISHVSVTSSSRHFHLPLQHVENVSSMDVHALNGLLYWSERSSRSIWRATIDGSHQQQIVKLQNGKSPESVAVDWLAGNLYWLTSDGESIEVSLLDGSFRRILVWGGLYHPHVLSLDLNNGYLFWGDRGSHRSIYRAHLDCSDPVEYVPHAGPVSALTVDLDSMRLFWLNTDGSRVHSTSLDGTSASSSGTWDLPLSSTARPAALAVSEQYVFWADGRQDAVTRADKLTGGDRRTLLHSASSVSDLLLYRQPRQSPRLPDNACSSPLLAPTLQCSQLCFSLARVSQLHVPQRRCGCRSQFLLQADGVTCSPPSRFLLYTQRRALRRHVFVQGELPDTTLSLHHVAGSPSLSYDHNNHHVYWVDAKRTVIRRGRDDSKSSTVFLSSHNSAFRPFSIQVDWYAGVIFWSCTAQNVINVTRLNGSSVGTVIGGNGSGDIPRHIALLPATGYLVFANWVEPARVEVARVDGSGRRVLRQLRQPPSALTTDHRRNAIYWTDADCIWTAELTSSARQLVVLERRQQVIISGLAVLGQYIYWLDQHSALLQRADVVTGLRRHTVVSGADSATALLAVSHVSRNEVVSHPCYGSWLCSHVCVLTESGSARCSCPLGMQLQSDNRTCRFAPRCLAGERWCGAGEGNRACVPLRAVCDGRVDCAGSDSDEGECPTCEPDELACPHQQHCFPAALVCNAPVECGDSGGLDEQVCCGPAQFACRRSRQCVPLLVVCDGRADCRSGEDEWGVNCSAGSSAPSGTRSLAVILTVCLASAVLLIAVAVLWWCYCILHRTKSTAAHGQSSEPFSAALVRDDRRQSPRYETILLNNSPAHIAQPDPTCIGSRAVSVSCNECCSDKPPLNPPPSPATSGAPASHRYFRLCSHPPPPTPCSTDVCDSDSMMTGVFPVGGRNMRMLADSDYESDIFSADKSRLPPAPPPSVAALSHHQSRRAPRPEAPPPSPVNEEYVL